MLEDALDELYGVEPGEFTATRKALRDRLRDAGEGEAAKELARARRPTKAAWALNQLAREHPELIDEVLERTRDLEAAQTRAQADDVRDASRERRRALAAAADAAVAAAARISASADTHRESILATLEAGSVDEAGAAALRAGRHVRDTPGPVGFPGTAPASAPAPTARPAKRKAKAPARTSGDGDTQTAEADAARQRASDDARAELGEAEEAARAASEHAEDAARAAFAAKERVAAAEAEVERARDELRVAQRDEREARAAAQKVQRAADAAAKAAEAVRRRVAALDG